MSQSVTLNPTLVDGYAGREGADEVWGSMKVGGGNTNNSVSTAVTMRLQTTATTDHFQAMRRGFFSLDPTTLSIPTGYIITAVSLDLYCQSKADSFAQSLCVCSGTLASSTAIADSDYQGTNSNVTEWATRKTIASLTTSAHNVWAFNAAGITAITAAIVGGTPIVLAFRFSGDVDNSAPTWSSGVTDDTVFSSQQDATSSRRPLLTITYRIGPGHGIVSLTGTLGNTGDSVTCSMWTIEVFA